LAYLVAGIFASIIVTLMLARWVGLIVTAAQKHGGEYLGLPRRRLLAALPLIAFIHPGPWLLLASILVTVRILGSDVNRAMHWAVYGFYGQLVLIGLIMLLVLRKAKRTLESGPRT
jgi:hypothetical protein